LIFFIRFGQNFPYWPLLCSGPAVLRK